MLRLHLRESHAIDGFERKFVAQLNDTHRRSPSPS